MAEDKKSSRIAENLAGMVTAENIQKYVLGTNKSGQPRALYDIVKDFTKGSKKKKKKKDKGSKGGNTFDLYVTAKKGKKKKKKNKHWHI